MNDKNFYKTLPHREGVDPVGYYVAIKSEEDEKNYKGYFVSEKDGSVIEYFKPTEWYNISYLLKHGDDVSIKYVDDECLIRNNKTGNILVGWVTDNNYIRFKINNKHRYYYHKVMGLTSIPRVSLDKSITIDHIDKNRGNNHLENLQWADWSMQRGNQKEHEHNSIYVNYTDSGEKIYYSWKDLDKKKRESISKYVSRNHNNPNREWDIFDRELYEELGGDYSIIDSSLWKPWPLFIPNRKVKNLELHPLGLIRKNNYLITKGSLKSDGRYYFGNFGVNRMMIQTFKDANLPNDLVIDHKDTNPRNNRIENLKACTQKENMNNPITKAKLGKKVIQLNKNKTKIINKFNSLSEVCLSLGQVNKNNIWTCATNIRKSAYGFSWIFEEDFLNFLDTVEDPEIKDNLLKQYQSL